ncbi:MAG: hypothetical protein H6916_01665 [Novosphingobium sp.]|uniref:hypothetical protein n=1 Tax=Novosphingobium sp. TaxID=1874826 RepID=UPI001DE28798|nr:hypothetical protein [Novosphingobium sp.]MCB2056909.1 hypothetical protein [Novosphingobium sp.]MCP5385512.1 hypothetical protein [Novosphingobium sp.]
MALPPDNSPNPGPTNPGKQNDREAAAQDVFLREVDDALRRDDMLRLAKRYGRPLGIVIGAGLLALAGYLWWHESQLKDAAGKSEQTILALDRMGSGGIALDAAARDLEPLIKDGSDGSKANAAMLHAAILQEQGKSEQAAKEFAALAADAKAPQPHRDLALIREVSIRYESMPPQDVVSRLKPLAVPGNPWFGSAGELTAMALLKQNKQAEAGAILVAIGKDEKVPDPIRARARQLAAQIGFDAGIEMKQIEEAAQAAGQPQQ